VVGRPARRQAFEHLARLEDLDRPRQRHHAYARAAVPLALDEVLLLEPHERGPDRRAADAQRLDEVGLDEALVRLQLSADDRLVQRAVGLVRRPAGRAATCGAGAQAAPPVLRQPPPA
jgi:hypothetical protein